MSAPPFIPQPQNQPQLPQQPNYAPEPVQANYQSQPQASASQASASQYGQPQYGQPQYGQPQQAYTQQYSQPMQYPAPRGPVPAGGLGSRPAQQTPIAHQPKNKRSALIVLIVVLAALVIGAVVLIGSKLLGGNNAEQGTPKAETPKSAPAEQVFQGVELAWAEPAQVPFSHIAPTRVIASEPAPESSHVMIIGWNDTQAEVSVIDASTQQPVNISETSIDVTALGGQTTPEGTLLVDLPEGASADSVPINIGGDAALSGEPAVVTPADTTANAPSIDDIALPQGVSYTPLIVGADLEGTEHAIVAASDFENPEVCKIVDYTMDGTPMWVQDLSVPCEQVSANNNGRIHAVTLDPESGAVTLQEYEPAAEPMPTPSEADLPAALPADYIKQIDIYNKFVPYGYYERSHCPNFPYRFNADPIPALEPMPDTEKDCWLKLTDGNSDALWEAEPGGAINTGDPVVSWGNMGEWNNQYRDIDGDGYLDAVVVGGSGGGMAYWIYVFNPQDPLHPDAAGFFMGSAGGNLEFDGAGGITETDEGQLRGQYQITRNAEGRAQLQ